MVTINWKDPFSFFIYVLSQVKKKFEAGEHTTHLSIPLHACTGDVARKNRQSYYWRFRGLQHFMLFLFRIYNSKYISSVNTYVITCKQISESCQVYSLGVFLCWAGSDWEHNWVRCELILKFTSTCILIRLPVKKIIRMDTSKHIIFFYFPLSWIHFHGKTGPWFDSDHIPFSRTSFLAADTLIHLSYIKAINIHFVRMTFVFFWTTNKAGL